jgi:hypothetical protein
VTLLLAVREIKATGKKGPLNEEWFVVENVSDKPLSTAGCAIGVAKGTGRVRVLGTLDPGFSIAPGEKVRVVTGNPGRKSEGKPPETPGIRNYHLFHGEPLLAAGPGSTVALLLRQMEIARGTFDPAAPGGVSAPKT